MQGHFGYPHAIKPCGLVPQGLPGCLGQTRKAPSPRGTASIGGQSVFGLQGYAEAVAGKYVERG